MGTEPATGSTAPHGDGGDDDPADTDTDGDHADVDADAPLDRGSGLLGPLAAHPLRAGGAIASLVLARAVLFAVQGVGFVHDDWAMVGHRQLLGVWETSSASLLDAPRPVQWLTFAGLFGISGERPLVLFALVTLLNVVAALVLWRVLLRFFAPVTALLVTATWVLVPNHTTLTVWGATSYVVVALTLLLLGVLALAHGRWLLALPLLVACIWGYELLAVPAAVAIVLVPGPLLRTPAPRRVAWWSRATLLLAVFGATARSLIDPIYESTARLPDPMVVWWGHFGSGLLGSTRVPGWQQLGMVLLAAVLVAACAWLLGDRSREAGPTLVVVGLLVLGLGLGAGFVIPMGTAGMSDRLHVTSSIGSALVLVGLVRFVRTLAPPLVVPAVAALITVCLVGQVVGSRAWTRADDDVVQLMAAIESRSADPANDRILVGPTPIQRDGVRSASGSELRWVVALRHGSGRGTIRLAQNASEMGDTSDFDLVLRWPEVTDTSGTDDLGG